MKFIINDAGGVKASALSRMVLRPANRHKTKVAQAVSPVLNALAKRSVLVPRGSFVQRCAEPLSRGRAFTGAVLWAIVLSSAAALSAQTGDTAPAPAPIKKTAKTTKTAETKKAATTMAQPLTIPADAVAKPDGSYSYTDQSGKKWIYNKTPFGVSKIQDVGESAANPFVTTPKEQLIQATDAGDTVKFQRQTPFGVTKWEKKKSDLTDEERQIFESQQPKPLPPQPE